MYRYACLCSLFPGQGKRAVPKRIHSEQFICKLTISDAILQFLAFLLNCVKCIRLVRYMDERLACSSVHLICQIQRDVIFRQTQQWTDMPTRVDSRATATQRRKHICLETVPAKPNPKRSHELHSLECGRTQQQRG